VTTEGFGGDDIAIIGMSGAFAGAPDLETLWQNLRKGVDTLDRSAQCDSAGRILVGSVLPRADYFDPEFFDLPQRDATWMDPQQRVFLEHAWQALDHAGLDAAQYRGNIGVFAGSSGSTYFLELLAAYRDASESDRLQLMFGNSTSYLATRVSYKLGLTGPSFTVSTACSSSLVAVHLACQSLLAFECDAALAGGVAVQSPPRTSYRYEPGGILSPDGYCRALDEHANGTVFSDGVGVVVLKRFAEARAAGDRVLAIIRGSALNNDGSHKAGYAAPSARGQRAVVAEAIANAGIDARSLGYIEVHGTGTRLGDAVELRALREAFEAAGAAGAEPCAVGSIKANIGHADAAAGIAGLLKTVLCLQHRTLVPQIHYQSPNSELDQRFFWVNREERPWPGERGPRRAGVSSFGVGGSNVHVVLEEAPARPDSPSERRLHLWPLSAKTPSALRATVSRLIAAIEREHSLLAPDIAFTLQTGRRAFDQRAAITCADTAQGIERLRRLLTQLPDAASPKAAPPSGLTFRFPPAVQPFADYTAFRREDPAFRHSFDELVTGALELTPGAAGETLTEELLRPGSSHGSIADRLRALVVPIALARALIRCGVNPTHCEGAGVGALAADVVAGRITVQQAIGSRLASKEDDALRADTLLAESWSDRPHSGALVLEIGARICVRSRSDMRLPGTTTLLEDSTDSPSSDFLRALGTLWLAGIEVDWSGHSPDAQRCRVALPSYPFDRRQLGLRSGADLADCATAATPIVAPRPQLSTSYRAPSTPDERAIAQVWCDALGLATVGVDDDFFELGGDSILASSVISKLQQMHAVELPLESLLSEPTIAFLAQQLTRRSGDTGPQVQSGIRGSALLDALERVERPDSDAADTRTPNARRLETAEAHDSEQLGVEYR